MVSKLEDKFVFSAEAMRAINISVEQLQQNLFELKSILGNKFDLVIPNQINEISKLRWIIHLNQSLQKLKKCEGFDRHIGAYNKKQIESNYFVTIMACYLLDKGIGNIVLEPPIIGKSNKSDILLDFIDQNIYFECKHTEKLDFSYSKEHEHMISILRYYISVPHQISITYKEPLSDNELHKLGETLRQNLSSITGNGRIINNTNLDIQVFKREIYGDKRFNMSMEMICQDIINSCNYPGHLYSMDGITMSLCGPKVDYTSILREKLKKSKRQSPNDSPYILVIDGNSMLGDLAENIRALSTAFQPDLNTRFSAAMIVTYYLKLNKSAVDFGFKFIPNPYAQFPLNRDFESLILSS